MQVTLHSQSSLGSRLGGSEIRAHNVVLTRSAVVAARRHWRVAIKSQAIAGAAAPITDAAITQALVPLQSSRAVERVAELARAWAQIAHRLPSHAQGNVDSQLLVISALRLAISWLENAPLRADGRSPSARAVQLAALLADLCAAGLPLDPPAIAAGILLEAADTGFLDHNTILSKLGPEVASLVHDCLRVRTAPQRVELYDDTASSAIREWCIAFNDIRANVVEVVARWDELRASTALPVYERQALALEALQVYAPLGHALGLGAVSAAMEDLCFQALFPDSYAHTSEWLHAVVDPAEDALYGAQQQLLAALEQHPTFNTLAAGCVLRARTKSLFSMMKKVLRLGELGKGGRRREEVYDLLGMRAVVAPRTDLPPDEAEALAVQACYVVHEVAQQLWRAVPERTKDYIAAPKSNGYRCIHLTLCMASVMASQSTGQPQGTPAGSSTQQQQAPVSAAGSTGSKQGLSGRQSPLASAAMSCDESPDHDPPTSSASSSTSSMDSGGEGGAGAAPYMELQIRTQAMDERAESGDASHAHYKGGLDARQARQLQAWTRELQHRLAVKPQNKLLLPPSVIARAENGAGFNVLESIDVDAELDTDYLPGTFPGGSTPTASSLNTTNTSPDASGGAAAFTPANPGPAKRRTAAEVLFRFMDRNGDGRLSVEELREQLNELLAARGGGAAPAWASTASSPFSFDAPGDMSSMSMGSMMSMDGGWGPQPYGAHAQGAAPAGGAGAGAGGEEAADLIRLMSGQEGEMSLADFKAFIKRASRLQAQKRKQQQQQQMLQAQQLQQTAEQEAWGGGLQQQQGPFQV